jgi:LuxR family transcriptional regulator, maltose regulon positive regulatory protein
VFEAKLAEIINAVAAAPEASMVVLDDYHVIHNPLVHQMLAYLIDHQPPQMRLALLTREDPLLPISRLRARGQMVEIRQDDLRFSLEECAQFLQHSMGIPLNQEEVAALERRTEGWVVGLQLAALSMRGREDLPGFIDAFTGSSRFILGYLLEEVFDRQSSEVKDFLMKTSILERLSAPLCDAVAETKNSHSLLAHLEQANLFIIPLEPTGAWYRYHHLFVELLQHCLRLSEIPAASLHQRASQWFETQGFLQEAAEHSILAEDWGNAMRLIGALNESLFKRGEAVTLLGLCRKLPQEALYANLELSLVYIWAALITSQFDIASIALAHAEQIAPQGSPAQGLVAAAQAFLARAMHNDDRAIAHSEHSLALLPESAVGMRGNIAMNLGLAYWHEGRSLAAEAALRQACDLCQQAGNSYALLTAQIFLARIPSIQGKLHQAAEMCMALLRGSTDAPILCLTHFDLATIYHEWNELPKALEHFKRGFELCQRSKNVEFIQSAQLLRAILAWAQRDEAEALAALDEAARLGRDFPPAVRSRAAAFGVQLALRRNDPAMLTHWAGQINAGVDSHSFYRFLGLTPARLLIAQEKKEEAAEALKTLYETAQRAGWGYGMLVIRILQSLSAKTTAEALSYLNEALVFGQLEGYVRSFVDAGGSINPLLQEAALRSKTPEYIGKILAALNVEAGTSTSHNVNLVEPLSKRELEVLRLITAGLSNREIAKTLFVSPGTAKTHIHHICAKLGVRNRTEAAIRAKDLHLV